MLARESLTDTVSLWAQEEEAGCGHDGDRGGPLRRVLGSLPRRAHAGGIQ